MPLNSVPRKGKRIRDGTSNAKRIKFVKGKKIGFGGGGGGRRVSRSSSEGDAQPGNFVVCDRAVR